MSACATSPPASLRLCDVCRFRSRHAHRFRELSAPHRLLSVPTASARATAEASAGFGAAGQALSGANPEDEYVFWQSPGDFGGVGVVSVRSGLAVFGGSIVWGGSGASDRRAGPRRRAQRGEPRERRPPPVSARVYLGDLLVGHLAPGPKRVRFRVDPAYTAAPDRPVLSQSVEQLVLNSERDFQGESDAEPLPTFFANPLLPEGALRTPRAVWPGVRAALPPFTRDAVDRHLAACELR